MANYNIDAIYNGSTSLPGTERVRIDSSGNIGIGTATPSTKLHIYENANRVTYISQNNNHTARFEAYGTATAIDTTASNGIFFRINSGDIVKFAADGNVGIGTSTAGAPLHIYRASNPWIRLNGGGSFGYIRFDDGTSNGYLFKNTSSDTTNGALAGAMYTYTDSNKAFQHIHSGTPLFTILSGGNVGIGTTSPSTKLHVVGNADIGDSTADTGIIVRHGAGSAQYGRIRFYDSGGNNIHTIHSFPTAWQGGTFLNSSAGALNLTGTNGVTFGAWNSVDVAFASNGNNYFKGNVGIGVTTAATKFVVSADATDSDVGQLRVIGSTSTAKMINVGYHTTNNYGFISSLIAGSGYSALSLQPNGGNVGIATVSPDVRLHVINGTTKLNKNNYKTTTAYSTADLVLGDDVSSRTGYAGNGSNLVLHANGTTSITFLDQTRNLGEITYSNKLFTIGGDIGWGTASVSFPGTVNFGANIYHSIGGQKFFAGSGGNYAYLYTGGVALNFLNSTDTSTLMTVLNDGNVGIGTTSPNKKLQVIGSLGKGYNLYEVPIALLTALATQAKRYEIARVFIDYNDWNSTGPVEIEVRESYYSDGRYKRYVFSYGYNSSNVGSLWLVEDTGRGANDFKAEAGAAVQVSGDIYYVPIYIDIDYYQYVDVLVRTNRTRTTNASSTSGGVIYINESPTGSNISSFSPDEVTYISLASSKTYLGYSGNVGIGTSSPATKLEVYRLESTNRTTTTDILTINADANNSPFSGHGGTILFRGGTYSGTSNNVQGNRKWGQIGMYLTDAFNQFSGENMFFAVASDDRSDTLTTAMTIQYNGNIGIGLTTPTQKLEVAGYVMAGESSYRASIYGNAGGAWIAFGTTNNTVSLGQIGAYNSLFNINSINGDTSFQYNGSEKMRITTGGNVGIGTTSPTQRLHVLTTGGSTTAPNIVATFQANTATTILAGGGTAIKFVGVSSGGNLQDYDQGMISTLGYADNNRHGMQFWVKPNASTVLTVGQTIDSNGNVGIGTTSPANSKLHIYADHVSGHSVVKIQTITAIASGGVPSLALFDSDGSRNTLLYAASDGTYLANEVVKPIIFSTNGTERMRVASDGNVGIGTTSPAAKLQVNVNSVTGVRINGTGGFANIISQGGHLEFYKDSTPTYAAAIGLSTPATALSNNIQFATYNGSSWSARMTIENGGNVGIGTTSPAYKLDVNTANDSAIRIRNGGGGANNGLALSVGSGSPWLDITEGVEFRIKGNTYANIGTWNSGNNTKLLIDSNGNIGIGTTSPNAKLVIDSSEPRFRLNISGTNHIILNHDGSTAILRTESNTPFTFGTNGTEKMRIAAGGSVGIGTTNPSQALEVSGTVKATSYIGDFTGRLVRTSTTQTITGNSALTIDVAAAYIHIITVQASGGTFGISSVTYNNRKAGPEVDEIILIFKWPASGSGVISITNLIGDAVDFNYGKATVVRLTSYKGTGGLWICEKIASNIDYTNL